MNREQPIVAILQTGKANIMNTQTKNTHITVLQAAIERYAAASATLEVEKKVAYATRHITDFSIYNAAVSEEGNAAANLMQVRLDTIDAILQAARRPCPEVRAVNQMLCSDGVYRSVFGIPSNVTVPRPIQQRIAGYVYYDASNNTTYGVRHESPEIAAAEWLHSELRRASEFRKSLESSSDERLAEQASYWVK